MGGEKPQEKNFIIVDIERRPTQCTVLDGATAGSVLMPPPKPKPVPTAQTAGPVPVPDPKNV
jgi:hypothetical protein